MKTSEILELIRAGFTREDIMNMEAGEPGEAKKEEAPVEQPEQKKEQPAEHREEQKPAEQAQDRTGEVLAAIAELTKSIQAMNIKNARIGIPEDEDTEAILAEVINPTKKRK